MRCFELLVNFFIQIIYLMCSWIWIWLLVFQCVPYFDTEGCQHPGCDPLYPTPECVQECSDNTDWQTSKYYASSAYAVGSDSYDIMAEVYTNGPVEVSFHVFEVSVVLFFLAFMHVSFSEDHWKRGFKTSVCNQSWSNSFRSWHNKPSFRKGTHIWEEADLLPSFLTSVWCVVGTG